MDKDSVSVEIIFAGHSIRAQIPLADLNLPQNASSKDINAAAVNEVFSTIEVWVELWVEDEEPEQSSESDSH